MQIAIFSTLFPLVFGTIVGIADWLLRWMAGCDLRPARRSVMTFPFFVIVIAIVAVLGPGLLNMYIAISAINGCSMPG